MSTLEKILQKPESYRRKAAYIITGMIGVMIFSIWLLVAGQKFKQTIMPSQEKMEEAEKLRSQLPSFDKESLKATIINPETESQTVQEKAPHEIAAPDSPDFNKLVK